MIYSFLFAAWLGYQELEWWSPYYRVAIAEAYEFGFNYEEAYNQKQVSERMMKWLEELQSTANSPEEKAIYKIEIEWHHHRLQAWRHLTTALNPSESFFSRRFALSLLRDDLAALGLGFKRLWDRRVMPQPVWSDTN